jgi:lipopolysaccharide transport system permease protein
MIRELVRYRALIRNLVATDLKLKYRDSALGFLWSLLNPLLLLVVYTLAIKHIMRIQMEHYTYFLLVGLLPWTFFSGAAQASTRSVVGNASLLKKAYFPRETLPIATVLFNFAQLLLALAVFLPALVLVSGVPIHWTALFFLPLLALHLLFTLGLAFLLSAVTTSFRDVTHLTEVAFFLLFWLTPVIYPASMAPAELQLFFKASPLAAFTTSYQDLLFWGQVPDLLRLVTIVAWTMAALLVGVGIFRWYSPAFTEEV